MSMNTDTDLWAVAVNHATGAEISERLPPDGDCFVLPIRANAGDVRVLVHRGTTPVAWFQVQNVNSGDTITIGPLC